MTDRAHHLAHFLVVDAARQSPPLAQHFIELTAPLSNDALPPAPRPQGRWPALEPDELSLGFGIAERVVRGAGFAVEADRLATLGETHGNG